MLAPCPYPSPLGTAVCIRQLAWALGAWGHTVHVVSYAARAEGGVRRDGPTVHHAVHNTQLPLRSGPQRGKMLADLRLGRYAMRLTRQLPFDFLDGHHVEGIVLGWMLRRACKLPLVGHMHTRLGLELPTYLRPKPMRQLSAQAGTFVDGLLPRAVDALVTLSAADAALCQPHVPLGRVFVRHPYVKTSSGSGARYTAHADLAPRRGPYAIYSGNADVYQHLELLCAAVRQHPMPLVLATHGSLEGFKAYPWPKQTQLVQVATMDAMMAWLRGARVGVCPRVQACGYPIKWLNYWQAGLRLVATTPMGRATFGVALGTEIHGPSIWAAPTADSFGRAMHAAVARPAPMPWTPVDPAASYAQIYQAAKNSYAQSLSSVFLKIV